MAKQPQKPTVAAAAVEESRGRSITLPNGQKRSDYIRDAYYNKEQTRSDIRKAINEMLVAAKREDETIPYQIVFAATKEETDPRIATKERAAAAKKEKANKAAAQPPKAPVTATGKKAK